MKELHKGIHLIGNITTPQKGLPSVAHMIHDEFYPVLPRHPPAAGANLLSNHSNPDRTPMSPKMTPSPPLKHILTDNPPASFLRRHSMGQPTFPSPSTLATNQRLMQPPHHRDRRAETNLRTRH